MIPFPSRPSTLYLDLPGNSHTFCRVDSRCSRKTSGGCHSGNSGPSNNISWPRFPLLHGVSSSGTTWIAISNLSLYHTLKGSIPLTCKLLLMFVSIASDQSGFFIFGKDMSVHFLAVSGVGCGSAELIQPFWPVLKYTILLERIESK